MSGPIFTGSNKMSYGDDPEGLVVIDELRWLDVDPDGLQGQSAPGTPYDGALAGSSARVT